MRTTDTASPAIDGASSPTSLAAPPAAPRAMKPRGPATPKRVKTPNCTHIIMDRVYGRDQHCYVCGRTPAIGFLYVCRQDTSPPIISDGIGEEQHAQNGLESTSLSRGLREIGLSESVIETAERGLYTDAQLEKLKKQKWELKQTIEDAIQGRKTNAIVEKLVESLAKGPSNNDGAFNSASDAPAQPPTCLLQACHTCRPYYKDRIYTSIGAIVTNQLTPITSIELNSLPTKDANKLRTIGLLPSTLTPTTPTDDDISPSTLPTSTDLSSSLISNSTGNHTPSRSSVHTFKTTQTDLSVVHRIKGPRRRFYNLANKSSGSIARNLATNPLFSRHGLKSVIQGIFKNNRESSSASSTITLPLPRTGTMRDLTAGEHGERVGEFDVGSLRRVRRQKERMDLRNGVYPSDGFDLGYGKHNNAMSKKLPTTSLNTHAHETADADPGANTDSETSESDFSVYSCTSEGSEVEVSGGVALTEEAVETHTPDILDDMNMGRHIGVALDSIMTQA